MTTELTKLKAMERRGFIKAATTLCASAAAASYASGASDTGTSGIPSSAPEQNQALGLAAAADFVVYVEPDGTVCAQSATDRAVFAHGKDAAVVIQQALDRLPQEGGKLYIATGCYWLQSTLKIEDKHGVHIEGAARGILFSGGKEGTVLRSTRDIDLLEIFGNKTKVAGVTIANLHLIGSGKGNGKAGILVRGGSDLLSLHNVGVNHCGIGFHLRGGEGATPGVIDAPQIQFCDPQVNGVGLKVERSHYTKIVGGEFSDCDNEGILLSSPDSGHARLGGAKISGITAVRNGRAGILIGRNTEDITVTGGSDVGGTRAGSGIEISDEGSGNGPKNVIISTVHAYNNSHAGIKVSGARHVILVGCICSGHDHVAVENFGQQYGVEVAATAEDVSLSGLIAYGNKLGAVRNDSRTTRDESR